MSFALSLTAVLPEVDVHQVGLVVVSETTYSFLRHIFEAGESIDLGDLALELRSRHMFLVGSFVVP